MNNLKMATGEIRHPRIYRIIIALSGFTVLGLSIATLIGWATTNTFLTSLGNDYIPMAPTTAILFLIISCAYLLILAARRNPTIRVIALTSAIIVLIFSVLIFFLGLINVHPPFENLGFNIAQTVGKPVIGHMSLVTSFLFSLASLTVIILMICKKSFFSTFLPPMLSGTILFTSLVLITGYLIGKPILYSTNQVPVALNTAIAFLAVGICLIFESTLLVKSHERSIARDNNSAIHVFSMVVAIIITGIMFFGYLNIQTIFNNLQEELRIQLTLISESKSLEIQRHFESGKGSDQLESMLQWPIAEKPGRIYIVPDSSNITGVPGYRGMAEVPGQAGHKCIISISDIPDSGFVVISSIDRQAALRPMVEQFVQVTTLILCLLALTIVALILFTRQTKLRYYKDELLSAEKLSLVEDQFRKAFENSSVGKTMIYPDGTYLVNKAFADMVGYTVEELNSMNWTDISHPDDLHVNHEAMNAMLRGETQNVRFEKRYVHKGGKIVWVDLQSYLQRDKDGAPLYFITSASDISEYKKLQEELIRSKEEAEQSNHLKDAFIANITHEIRTPLNAILGFTDLLRDDLEEKGITDYENYFDIIRSSGMRLTRTVDLILNVSRLQVGAYQPHIGEIAIDSLVFDLVAEYRLAAQKKGLTLTFNNTLGRITIEGDDYCLTHSISNLIDNAIKYTHQGSITLVLYKKPDDHVCLDVEDTGIGISQEFVDKVFYPFTQEDPGSTRRFEGIGLGLSIAHRLLSVSGAAISVKSRKGEGSVFTVTF